MTPTKRTTKKVVNDVPEYPIEVDTSTDYYASVVNFKHNGITYFHLTPSEHEFCCGAMLIGDFYTRHDIPDDMIPYLGMALERYIARTFHNCVVQCTTISSQATVEKILEVAGFKRTIRRCHIDPESHGRKRYISGWQR